MTSPILFQKTARAAVVAIVLAVVAMSPAQAAPPNLSSSFSLEVKPQGGDQKQLQQFRNRQFAPSDFYDWCLTDRQIRRGLRSYGFTDIELVGNSSRNRVRVEATYGDWVYSMRVHRCSGMVDRIKKLYPVWEDDDYEYWY